MAINSLAIINYNTFATSSNDQKVKIWGFTPNFIIHEKSLITLNNALCLSLHFHKERNLLFLATSNKSIISYDLTDNNNPKLYLEYVGHERTARHLTLN